MLPPTLRVPDELIPPALHTAGQYANNPIEADHGRLKARLRPMRGLKSHRSARILAAGHAFVQNLRRGHYDIATRSPRPPQASRGIRRPRARHLNPPKHLDHAPTLFREDTTQQCQVISSAISWVAGLMAGGAGALRARR